MVTDELLTTQEVAERLKVHINTVYNYIDSGKLKAIRMEGLLRIRISELEHFLLNCQIETIQMDETIAEG